MRLNAYGITAGIGYNVWSRWKWTEPQPIAIATGSAGGWFDNETAIGTNGADVLTARAPDFAPTFLDEFAPNWLYAGGENWLVTRATPFLTAGEVPDNLTDWTAADCGPDGSMALVKNGVFTVVWPNGLNQTEVHNAVDLRCCDGQIVYKVGDEILVSTMLDRDLPVIPQQLPGAKYWATTLTGNPDWLMYQNATGYGLVLHHINDASQGYQWNVAAYSPEGITLADGTTWIAWSKGAAELPTDLVRVSLILGQGMQPLVPYTTPSPEPPDPEPPNPEPEPEPPQPEPPDPGPTPEPDPMPPTNPLKPGKTPDAYWDALAQIISTDPHALMSFLDAKQGVKETWDQLNAAKDWMSGNACVRGACSRNGAGSITVPQLTWDQVSPLVRKVDLEFLQRG